MMERAFAPEPTPMRGGNGINPLDKRMAHRQVPEASGQIPSPPADPSPPKGGTLAPGQRITF
jgi:hypothetical protein